jgi:hypothetical protein
MKRFIAVAVLFTLIICLLSCSYKGTYEEGYSDGYGDGYSDAESDMQYAIEYEFFDGYDTGYSHGYDEGSHDGWIENIEEIGWYFEDEAEYYALQHSGWIPEEAWMVIEAYQNNEPLPDESSVPSTQDYLAAIDSLIYFYDYFYSARYE